VRAVTELLDITALQAHYLLNLRIADPSVWTSILNVALPSAPNTLVPFGGDGWIAWLGPDEWLLASPRPVDVLEAELRAAAEVASIVDVSAAQAIVQISGGGARRLLAHGCALDLHPREFPAGRCAQTRLALANVLIAAPVYGQSDFAMTPTFLVLVRSSFTRYLTQWLADAAVSAAVES
jgi:sarcosine oxidase subunit gamma